MNEKFYIKNSDGSFELIVPEYWDSGGFGNVFGIKSPVRYKDCCVKSYKNRKSLKLDKLEYMIQNPPANLINSDRFKFCWPMALIYDAHYQPTGFIMPNSFSNSQDLNILRFNVFGKHIHDRFKKSKDRPWWYKYERDTDEGLINRMKILCNCAIAFNTLHQTGDYVLIDIKPENIHATADGKISILDTDSIQISKNGKLLFGGDGETRDYFPRHGVILVQNNKPLDVDCDRFTMAVMFYMILIGPHPYASLMKLPPYDNCNTTREMIDAGLYAYGPKMDTYLKFPNPNPHKIFTRLSKDMQRLFMQAFSDNLNKPSSEDWAKCFIAEIRRFEEAIAERKRQQLIQQRAQEAKERRENIIMWAVVITFFLLVVFGIYKGVSAIVSTYRYHHTEYKVLMSEAESYVMQNKYDDAVNALREARNRKSRKKKIRAINERIEEVQNMKSDAIEQLKQEITTILNTFKTASFKYGRPENDFKTTQEKIDLLKSMSDDADCKKFQEDLDNIRKRKI